MSDPNTKPITPEVVTPLTILRDKCATYTSLPAVEEALPLLLASGARFTGPSARVLAKVFALVFRTGWDLAMEANKEIWDKAVKAADELDRGKEEKGTGNNE